MIRRVTRSTTGKLPTPIGSSSAQSRSAKTAAAKKTTTTAKKSKSITTAFKVQKAGATRGKKAVKGLGSKAAESTSESTSIAGSTNAPTPQAPENPVAVVQTTTESTETETTTTTTTKSSRSEPPPPHASASCPLLVLPPSPSTLSTGIAHLIKVSPNLAPILDPLPNSFRNFSPASLARPFSPFAALTESILSQQVSSAAAAAITARFMRIWGEGGRMPSPEMVLEVAPETLRAAGLSGRKVEYVRSLAEHFLDGSLNAETLLTATDEEVVKRLVAVRGLGVWSAEMFLLFWLRRMDVFPVGDLGVRRGVARFLGRTWKKGTKDGGVKDEEMREVGERFRPYRSLFSMCMWKLGDGGVVLGGENVVDR